MHWFWHVTGIDTQQSRWYDFWSGIGTQIALVLAGFGVYRKHNCAIKGCWRLGKFPHGDYHLCAKHHPRVPSDGEVTPEVIRASVRLDNLR